MNLFVDILSKVIWNKKNEAVRSFMLKLYKEAYPQMDNYMSKFVPTPRCEFFGSNLDLAHHETFGGDVHGSTKSTGRFKMKSDIDSEAYRAEMDAYISPRHRMEMTHDSRQPYSHAENRYLGSKEEQERDYLNRFR
jgi:hypothetical protein